MALLSFQCYYRLYGLLATAAAILSVDFDVFPRRFAKTSIFGRSVMDLGTATFVYCFAVVDVFRHYPGRVKNVIQEQRFCFLYFFLMLGKQRDNSIYV